MLAGGLGPDNVREAIDAVRPWAVDAARSTEREPGIKDHDARPRLRGGGASRMSPLTYGAYGGRYVPETLIPALDELEAGWRERAGRRRVPRRAARAARRTYAGRPTPLTRAERFAPGQAPLPQARGPPPHGRAQAEQRARPGRARAAARQAADRRRDGRRPARRRDRDRLRALRPRLRRLHGRRGHAPPAAERRADEPARRRGAAGRVRDEDAEGGDERGDPRLDHERRDDALPDRLVRRARAVPGDRARPAARDRRRGARAAARRSRAGCPRSSSRASAAARTRSAIFYGFLDDATCGSSASRPRAPRASAPAGAGVLHGARSSHPRRRRRPDRRRALDLRRASTTRASAPSTPRCATPAAPSTCRARTTEALAAFHRLAETEGIIPALESSHALARALDARRGARARLPLGPRRQGPRRGAAVRAELARPARPDRRALPVDEAREVRREQRERGQHLDHRRAARAAGVARRCRRRRDERRRDRVVEEVGEARRGRQAAERLLRDGPPRARRRRASRRGRTRGRAAAGRCAAARAGTPRVARAIASRTPRARRVAPSSTATTAATTSSGAGDARRPPRRRATVAAGSSRPPRRRRTASRGGQHPGGEPVGPAERGGSASASRKRHRRR